MKKLIFISTIAFLVIMVMSFVYDKDLKSNDGTKYLMPDDVKAIVSNKCAGCHNNASSNTKGKEKLNFDKMPDGYKTAKLIAKIIEIEEVIEEGEMPPKKFLTKYPDKKLSEQESVKLKSWANIMAKQLSAE